MGIRMTDYRKLVEREWLGQWDLELDGKLLEPTVRIESVTPFRPEVVRMKRMPDGSKRPEPNKKLAIRFHGKKKGFLCGPVNQKLIAGMYGNHIEGWIGKLVTLWVDTEVAFGREKTGGLRVRPMVPGGQETTAALDNPVDEAKASQLSEALEQAEADAAIGPGGVL